MIEHDTGRAMKSHFASTKIDFQLTSSLGKLMHGGGSTRFALGRLYNISQERLLQAISGVYHDGGASLKRVSPAEGRATTGRIRRGQPTFNELSGRYFNRWTIR